jgi:hypothetical protein
MPQITARLSPQARRRFEKYAISLGLNGSSLARLLLVRELQRPMKSPTRAGRRGGSEDGKLTAHSCSAETIRQLQAYADARRKSRAEVAKIVFERELRDRWLAKAIGSGPRVSK